MLRSCLCVLAFLALFATSLAPARAQETHALIIGWNGGGLGLSPLRYADDDALRFATVLQDEPSPSVVVLAELDADTRRRTAGQPMAFALRGAPTRSRVLQAFNELTASLTKARGAQRVFVIYAGHGLTNRLLLAPENGEEGALSGHELRAAISRLSAANPAAEISLFVDACRSQSLFTTRGDDGLDGPDMSRAIERFEGRSMGAHVGVITAATSGKPAGELKRLESGYFSHVLLSGILGGADANEDERISFGELAAFVAFHTQEMMGQRPWFDPPAGDLSALTFDHRTRARRLVLPRALEGRFEVRGPTGRPVFAELFKDVQQQITLALPEGRYRVLQASAQSGQREVDVQLSTSGSVNLGMVPWRTAATDARGAGDGDDEVQMNRLGFKAPFSREVVSTLQAGFNSGRQPSVAAESVTLGASWVTVSVGARSAPLSLSGESLNGGLLFRHFFSHTFAGVQLQVERGRYASASESFTLLQTHGQVQAGLWRAWAQRVWGLVWLEGGAGNLFRMAAQTSGDAFVPRLGAGFSAQWRAHGEWLLGLTPRMFVQWVNVDSVQQRNLGVALDIEVSRAF